MQARVVSREWLGIAIIGLAGVFFSLFLPSTAIAQQTPQVTRTVDFSGVGPEQTLIVTITPSGFTGFYAVKEQLGESELVAHTADNYEEGTFIMLGPQTFTYEVKLPQGALTVAALRVAASAINGQWWTDPGDKRGVISAETRLPVTQPTAKPVTQPTAKPVPPTATPVPTDTPVPTATPATPRVLARATLTPPTATPSPTPTPEVVAPVPGAGFPVGAIIGIVLGVIAVIAAGGVLYLWRSGRIFQGAQ